MKRWLFPEDVTEEGSLFSFWATDEEGGSCYCKEKRIFEVLGERTKGRGVCLVISLNVEETELLVGKTPGGSLFCS